ncbi:MAG: hypothetical protein ABW098_09895 [Candidatus Thiodiazotropha sp.]
MVDTDDKGSVMRFPQLTIGQLFEYQGKRYTKTGPLTASEEGTGVNEMIRRSAEVMLLEGAPIASSSEGTKQTYSRQEMLELCDDYKTKLQHQLRHMAAEEDGLRLEPVLQLLDTTLRIS